MTGRSEATNADSRIAAQTSRNETSFVRVYPCRTRGSARDAVESDCHGVGRLRASFLGVLEDEELERVDRLCEWGESER